MGFSSSEVYDYIDAIRKYSLDTHYVEDVCRVIVDFHKCGCKNRLHGIDEIVEYAEHNPDAFGDIFFRNGIDDGLDIVASLAKLILYKKRNLYIVIDLKYLSKNNSLSIKDMMHHIKQSGVMLIDSMKDVEFNVIEHSSFVIEESLTYDQILSRYHLSDQEKLNLSKLRRQGFNPSNQLLNE